MGPPRSKGGGRGRGCRDGRPELGLRSTSVAAPPLVSIGRTPTRPARPDPRGDQIGNSPRAARASAPRRTRVARRMYSRDGLDRASARDQPAASRDRTVAAGRRAARARLAMVSSTSGRGPRFRPFGHPPRRPFTRAASAFAADRDIPPARPREEKSGVMAEGRIPGWVLRAESAHNNG